MVQQKKELSLAEVGRTSGPLAWSRACAHIGWNTGLRPLTATVSGCVLRSVAKEEGHASG